MPRVGILTFSDGRDFVHQGVAGFAADVEGRIAAACEAFGCEVVRGTEPVTSSEMAVREARRLSAERPDLTIFNYPVWAFPHFSVHATAGHDRSPVALLQHRPHLSGHGRDAGRWGEPAAAGTSP